MTLVMVHGVWVNFVEGDLDNVMIPEYFEWMEGDNIVMYRDIPLVKVDPEGFNRIGVNYGNIPKTILNLVKGESKTRRDFRIDGYAFIITDGSRILAIRTLDNSKPSFKSKLLPRKAIDLIGMIEGIPPLKIDWDADDNGYIQKRPLVTEEDENTNINNKTTLLKEMENVKPSQIVGLTRRERAFKEILLKELYRMTSDYNQSEIIYWYSEVFPEKDKEGTTREVELYELMRDMYTEFKFGWSERHYSLGEGLSRGSLRVKKEWDAVIDKYTKEDKGNEQPRRSNN